MVTKRHEFTESACSRDTRCENARVNKNNYNWLQNLWACFPFGDVNVAGTRTPRLANYMENVLMDWYGANSEIKISFPISSDQKLLTPQLTVSITRQKYVPVQSQWIVGRYCMLKCNCWWKFDAVHVLANKVASDWQFPLLFSSADSGRGDVFLYAVDWQIICDQFSLADFVDVLCVRGVLFGNRNDSVGSLSHLCIKCLPAVTSFEIIRVWVSIARKNNDKKVKIEISQDLFWIICHLLPHRADHFIYFWFFWIVEKIILTM